MITRYERLWLALAVLLAFCVTLFLSIIQGKLLRPADDVMTGVKIEARYRAGRL